jgi:homospermidine synthase
MQVNFGGRVLVLGAGSVSQCLQPLLLRHLRMDFSKLTIMDFEDKRAEVRETLDAGAKYVQKKVTRTNLGTLLGKYVSKGDLIIDLAWNIDCGDITQWCHDNGVMYINTSVELWDPYGDAAATPPNERTLYFRHRKLRNRVASWRAGGPTIVVEHGANPGLVSHWTKVALTDIAQTILARRLPKARRVTLEQALAKKSWNVVAQQIGLKTIHISERDTQIADEPKQVDEFVNTWSVEGFYEEGIAPAEMGWGTHERSLPPGAHTYDYGPRSQICLAQCGINTQVRSWVPLGGEIVGMVVRHGEALTITEHLTVNDAEGKPVYRPTVHYAYLPTDAAIASLWEMRMNNYTMQSRWRIMNDEIIAGRDELGVLLLGHDLTAWWVGSQLDIDEARALVPGQNATTLQVAASVLGAVTWMIKNPTKGFCVPDDLPHDKVLEVANPYLGPCPSVPSDWTPLKNRVDLWSSWGGAKRPSEDDMWQFGSFLV